MNATNTEAVSVVTSKVLTYTLYVVGIWGRNRTVKRKGFKIAEVPATEPLSLETLQAKVPELVVKLKVKPGGKVSVYENPETVEDRGDGIQVRTFTCFAGKTILSLAV